MTPDFCRNLLLSECPAPIVVHLQRLIAMMHYSHYNNVMPSSVLLFRNNPMFPAGEQQDCSEYLAHLLNSLNDGERTEGFVPALDDQVHNFTIADKSFSGQLTNIYKCLVCSHESRIQNRFRELQLAFPDCGGNRKESFTVQSLIEYNSASDILDGDDKYACPSCATYCMGEHQTVITQGPRNLIITLKRFGYDKATHQHTKLMNKVYPNNTITLTQYNSTMHEVTILVYRLYAIVIHDGGTINSGHYYALARDAELRWVRFSDDVVSFMKCPEIRQLRTRDTAHMLFYALSAVKGTASPEDKENAMPLSPEEPLVLEELPAGLLDFVKPYLGGQPPSQS
ncbi:hypothetical protein AWZ03_012187 [Drosophila navojoa]|uniref:USP domain-containing protein n=2 Tax=Drosophila navojoa TaxID=7232 RepID=A0A484AY32_DRONA|nr:hypothetical protein AWZ03_012187 [Drosophila navojoa]